VADTDHSGELDYEEFKNAVRNYGLRQLSCGSLRTLFDSFDLDRGGSISHDEFIESLKAVPEPTGQQKTSPGRRVGPLERAAILEPKRVGFEATPPVLALGTLTVGVAYRAFLTAGRPRGDRPRGADGPAARAEAGNLPAPRREVGRTAPRRAPRRPPPRYSTWATRTCG